MNQFRPGFQFFGFALFIAISALLTGCSCNRDMIIGRLHLKDAYKLEDRIHAQDKVLYSCYLLAYPNASKRQSGIMVARINIKNNGKVKDAKVVYSNFKGKKANQALGECILKTVKGIQFPKIKNNKKPTFTLDYPFRYAGNS